MNDIKEPEDQDRLPAASRPQKKERRGIRILASYIANANRLRRKILGLLSREKPQTPAE